MQFQLLGWGPDLDPSTPGVLVDVEGVIPTVDGYEPMQPFIGAGSIGGSWRAFHLGRMSPGLRLHAALTDSTLGTPSAAASVYEYALQGGQSVVYNYGSTANTFTTPMIFRQFDDNIIIARAKNQLVSVTSAGVGGVITASPTCTTIESTKDFVVAFNTDAGFTWHCCAIGDERNWTVSVSNQCVRGRFYDVRDRITCASKYGENLAAWSQSQMWVGRYVGAPEVWQWDRVSGDVGCVGEEAAAETPYGLVWVSANDIHIYDGSVITPLDTQPVRRALFNSVSRQLIRYAQAFWERKRGIVWFAFPAAGDTVFRKRTAVFGYHFASKKWTKGGFSQFLFSEATFASMSPTAFPQGSIQDYTVGTASWASGVQQYDDLLIAADTGAASFLRVAQDQTAYATGWLQTGYFGDNVVKTMAKAVRPRFSSNDNSNGTLTLETRLQGLSGGSTASQTATLDTDFKYPLRQTGRWHSFRHVLTGTDRVSGYDIDLVPMGQR